MLRAYWELAVYYMWLKYGWADGKPCSPHPMVVCARLTIKLRYMLWMFLKIFFFRIVAATMAIVQVYSKSKVFTSRPHLLTVTSRYRVITPGDSFWQSIYTRRLRPRLSAAQYTCSVRPDRRKALVLCDHQTGLVRDIAWIIHKCMPYKLYSKLRA
jgi:hypothetical protein